MSEYTSTIEGFQRAMKWSLTGPPQEAKEYAEAVTTPTFHHIMDGQRLSYDDNIKRIQEWRGKCSHYEPVVRDFLRDGDMLAARMTGTLKIEGTDSEFETFFVAKLDSAGKMVWLKDRSVYGPVGEVVEKGAN
ncbi:hypothetical protein INS49_013300 [Diaporthe citri]|uniref:uncharacterized protein n=1 Tax=Diaporthe citri TaxID=83186 RepID=UPI001C7FA5A3|nr:uncharacterized protein INS49_013300 [Diaporthe citri]KAG6357423.1 hypothetical protein INS49_013300 [Diaporthe citri]